MPKRQLFERLGQFRKNQTLLTKEQLYACAGSPAIGICTNAFDM